MIWFLLIVLCAWSALFGIALEQRYHGGRVSIVLPPVAIGILTWAFVLIH